MKNNSLFDSKVSLALRKRVYCSPLSFISNDYTGSKFNSWSDIQAPENISSVRLRVHCEIMIQLFALYLDLKLSVSDTGLIMKCSEVKRSTILSF